MMLETKAAQPAPFTASIIRVLETFIPRHVPEGMVIHDPFAGEGVRLGALCNLLRHPFTGTDLEMWKGADPRVSLGDSTSLKTYPDVSYAIVTSPTYNNGLNDHFLPTDTSRRLTYRVAAGHALDLNNTGRWSGRGSKSAEERYWEITRRCVCHWSDLALVNVKDSIRDKKVYPLVDKWVLMMDEFGYRLVDQMDPACPGWRYGTNHEARSLTEAVLVFRR